MGPEDYRNNAEKCVELAQSSRDRSIRLGLFEMARSWLRLAAQAEKNVDDTITPIDRSASRSRHRDVSMALEPQ
jgi:hypothetical protein